MIFPDNTKEEIAKDFIKEQYKQRRQEIENYLNRIESDQKNGLLLTGAIWSWLAANFDTLKTLNEFRLIIILLPPALMIFFLIRCNVVHETISFNADYLKKLEDDFLEKSQGWELWLSEQRQTRPKTASLKSNHRFFGYYLFL